MTDEQNSRSVIPRPSHELTVRLTAQNRIVGEMVKSSLALAKHAALADVDLDALVREGKRIQRRQGMTPEDIHAFNLFHRAATAGHREGQCTVGYCFVWGHGVKADSAKAAHWFRLAAEQGDPDAQCQLGVYYSHEDIFESVKWYRKAAERGHEFAQECLADCYLEGKGVDKDYCEAYVWLQLSADSLAADPPSTGAELTREQAAAVASAMTPSQFARASQLYEEYKRKYSAKR